MHSVRNTLINKEGFARAHLINEVPQTTSVGWVLVYHMGGPTSPFYSTYYSLVSLVLYVQVFRIVHCSVCTKSWERASHWEVVRDNAGIDARHARPVVDAWEGSTVGRRV